MWRSPATCADDGSLPGDQSGPFQPQAGPGAFHRGFFWREGRSLSKEEVLDGWLLRAIAPHRQPLERIGHRVVHGGERFTAPTLITADVEDRLKQLIPLAPLHNPPAFKGLAWARQRAPDIPNGPASTRPSTAACRRRPLPMPFLSFSATRVCSAKAFTGSTTSKWLNRWRINDGSRAGTLLSCG